MPKNQHHHAFTDKLTNVSEDTLNKVDEVVDTLQTHTKKYSSAAENYIQKYPLKSIGIAVAAGALLAFLVRK
jgi:ElaB/YqjD/DUF883 family membrane-anchored ribosome-binding protein